MTQLRPYQSKLLADINSAWSDGARNVCAVAPTGAGKTVLFSEAIRQETGPSCAIAHRQELVSQMSLAMARTGIAHRIIGPRNVIRNIIQIQMDELGRSFYNPTALVAVAGVDTLIRRDTQLAKWLPTVKLWVTDECHHLIRENKWGTAVDMFPNARGLGVTATPWRTDGKGLGRHASGVIDRLVEGPSMRELIRMGYLTEYRVFAPPSNLDLSRIKVGSTGEFVQHDVADAVAQSSLVMGDIVEHYLRIARGKLGVTFVPSVDTAQRVAEQFNQAGIPAAAVSAQTPDRERFALLRKFRNRQLLQLVNVDLFGEGFDLPAIEVVSMGRPTESYGLFAQQFGRALRPMDGKSHAIIIDHVCNIAYANGQLHHGLPDAPRAWTLDDRDRKASNTPDDVMPLRVCHVCTGSYDRYLRVCPYCGAAVPPPSERNGPEFVDGDLTELDAETLAAMRGEVAEVERPTAEVVAEYRAELIAKGCPSIGVMAHVKRKAVEHDSRKLALATLRDTMLQWAGAQGHDDATTYRVFYLRFGIDWLTAQTQSAEDMAHLTERLKVGMVSG
jgi:superfamily II DNA or RNA helicase